MPKLVVLVEKDDRGKIWEHLLTQEDWRNCQSAFETAPLFIHKPDYSDNGPRRAQKVSTQEETVTVSALPQREKARNYVKIRKK